MPDNDLEGLLQNNHKYMDNRYISGGVYPLICYNQDTHLSLEPMWACQGGRWVSGMPCVERKRELQQYISDAAADGSTGGGQSKCNRGGYNTCMMPGHTTTDQDFQLQILFYGFTVGVALPNAC